MSRSLQLANVSLKLGGNQIISDLSLEVESHSLHAIIGPNGAGKSTLFNLISGFYRPQTGKVLFRDQDITGLPPHKICRLGVSRSFQITAIFPRLSVFENIRLGVLSGKGIRFSMTRAANSIPAVEEETDALIRSVRLEQVAARAAGDLTYSEQRALEIAMTLAPGPDLVLLDEPTAGMSVDESKYFVDLIARACAGKTVLVVEHDMDVVFSLCDRISVLVYGSIIATGNPSEIRSDKKVQEAYLGQPVE